jgi:hypothetical protein
MASKASAEWWEADALRRFASGSGESLRDIESALKIQAGTGRKAPSKSRLHRFLSANPPALAVRGQLEVNPAPIEPIPLDESEAAPDFAVRTLFGLLRRAREREERFASKKDDVGAQRAGRDAKELALAISKLQKKEEDDAGTHKVTAEDMQEAADRAWAGLNNQADRVIAEVAAWPVGPDGVRRGTFADVDTSPVREMFLRVVRAVLA